jgi:TetR/AcrR family transcriptional regulator, regulator of cefoperazone and chloramphenicol sensitivity
VHRGKGGEGGEEDVAATRARILEAAGAVFASRGYREGTVREICGRAGANVSAVAYHFGSKAELYEAVMRRAQEYAAERYPISGLAAMATSDPEGALRRFIETMLRRLLDRGRPAWHGQLMTREMAEPSHAFHILSEEMARPMFAECAGILAELTGEPATSEHIRHCVSSVIGQCTVHRNARALLAVMHPGSGLDVDELVEHIARFSLAGLAAGRGTGLPNGRVAGRGEAPGDGPGNGSMRSQRRKR